MTWLVFIALVLGTVVTVAILGYQFTQSHYFVGADDGKVAIFRGVQQDLGPFPLSQVYEETSIDLGDLTPFLRDRVEATINATDLTDAHRIVDQLANDRLP